ncbi:MAG: flagella assembly protein FlgT middle domain-containing protein [Gallionella sp.]|nr:flagella assembly protein FlgT middle domain-containing protein [Gallionella sp.]
MLINVDPCFGNLLVPSIYKNSAYRYFAAALCISALFCMAQTVFAAPEPIKTDATQTTGIFTGRVQAEGIASIGAAGHNAARQTALIDALRNVAVSPSAHAMAEKPAIKPQQNANMQPATQGNRYSILREWKNQSKYHVMVSAEVVNGEFDEKNAILIQPPKKKIAITQFDVVNTIHVDDINNIYDGLPIALSNRMEASGRFLSAYTGRSIPMEAGAQQRETIIQVAGETGAQFLISGMVVNAGISHGKWPWDAKKRHFEVELSIYDGATGTRLMLRRLAELAQGDIVLGNNKPFGSNIFFETEFGKAANRLIDSAVKEIQEALENVPFSAHILRTEGRKVFFDAGSDSLLEPGDKLVAYAIDARTPVEGLQGSILGVTERAADTATLIHVKPQFSIGELSEDAEKLGIKAGNIARINFADQRDLAAKRVAAQQLAKARQEAKVEAERVKTEQAALAEAGRIKAEQAALAEAARIKAEKKAAAEAKAKAAKLKAQQEAKTARVSAAQKARARALAIRIKAAQKAKAQAAAEAKAAKLKEGQEASAETSQDKPETKTQTAAGAKPAKQEDEQKTKAEAPTDKSGKQNTQIQPEAQTATEGKAQQTIKNGEPKEKTKRIVLPPGQETLKGKMKSSTP